MSGRPTTARTTAHTPGRRAGALLCAAALMAMGALATTATGAELRVDTGLGGFSVHADAAPLKVLVDDPSNPIPRPEDTAIVEADPAYTSADLGTGPAAIAIASTLWPGNLLGTGIPTATEGRAPQYPLKAESRYPDKPFTATGRLELQGNRIADDGGAVMRSHALGLDVGASARFNPVDIPGNLDVGALASHATATVTPQNVAVGRSTSSASDVSLLAGIVKIGSVSTVVHTTSDGRKPTSSGTTVVSGLTVGGVGYVVDEKGARPVGAPVPGSGALPTNALDPAKAAGITIDGIAQTGSTDPETATRQAKGLRIIVDTTVLRGVLNDKTPPEVLSALRGIFAQAPPQLRGNLFYTLSATPKITFILGAGDTTTSANLPLGFDFPPLPDVGGGGLTPDVPPAAGGTGSPVGGPALPGSGAPAPSLPEAGGAAPVVDGSSGSSPVLAGGTPLPASPPVSALLVLGALMAAALGGWGLTWLRGFAFGPGLTAGGCPLGAPSSVPSLREPEGE